MYSISSVLSEKSAFTRKVSVKKKIRFLVGCISDAIEF